jgi:hypothetical protein
MTKLHNLLLLIGSITMSSSAFAVVKNDISINSISSDGRYLDVAYSVGGGCAAHTAIAEVTLTVISEFTDEYTFEKVIGLSASISVYDVTDKRDPCEAVLYPKIKIDLKPLIEDQMKKEGYVDSAKIFYKIEQIKLPSIQPKL